MFVTGWAFETIEQNKQYAVDPSKHCLMVVGQPTEQS